LAAAQASREAAMRPVVVAESDRNRRSRRQESGSRCAQVHAGALHAAGLGTEFGASLCDTFDISTIDRSGLRA